MISKFLGNTKDSDYQSIVENMLDLLPSTWLSLTFEGSFLLAHVDCFLESLGDLSEENGDYFHQKMRAIEALHLERWDVTMMADYCWYLRRNFENG